MKGKARYQLGSSGGGNHFVNWATFVPDKEIEGTFGPLRPNKRYLAIMSHSGSRGFGFKIAQHYREIAEDRCWGLPDEMEKLAWLSLSEDSGREYWKAMQLAGAYASACHEVIHEQMAAKHLDPILDVEHHHNFAWRQNVNGKELIVHRKGATPANRGQFGIIPGNMAHGGYLVEGKGNADSLKSCSHGAGRRMSRSEAKERLDLQSRDGFLKANSVRLVGAGLDEHPRAYKDLEAVLANQKGLCEPIGAISNRVVRMADD